MVSNLVHRARIRTARAHRRTLLVKGVV